MKKLEETQKTTQLTIDLTTLDQNFRDPKFKGLMDQGYRIAQIIPVEDQGKPMGIFVFQLSKETEMARLFERYGKIVSVYLLLIFLLLSTITITLLS